MPGPPSDRGHNILRRYMQDFLHKREPPKTFCPSEVARSLTADELATMEYDSWRDAMPDIRQIAWELREEGQCEVVQKGESVGDIGPEDVKGPIRIRRTADT